MLGHYQNAHHPLSLMETTPSSRPSYPRKPRSCSQPALLLHTSFCQALGSFSSLGHQPLQDRDRGLLVYFSLSTPCLLSSHPRPSPCPPFLFPLAQPLASPSQPLAYLHAPAFPSFQSLISLFLSVSSSPPCPPAFAREMLIAAAIT